jgi:hypothetical protein
VIHVTYRPPAFPRPTPPPKQKVTPLAKFVAANILKNVLHGPSPLLRPSGGIPLPISRPPAPPQGQALAPAEGPLGDNAHLGWQPPVPNDIQQAILNQFLNHRSFGPAAY